MSKSRKLTWVPLPCVGCSDGGCTRKIDCICHFMDESSHIIEIYIVFCDTCWRLYQKCKSGIFLCTKCNDSPTGYCGIKNRWCMNPYDINDGLPLQRHMKCSESDVDQLFPLASLLTIDYGLIGYVKRAERVCDEVRKLSWDTKSRFSTIPYEVTLQIMSYIMA